MKFEVVVEYTPGAAGTPTKILSLAEKMKGKKGKSISSSLIEIQFDSRDHVDKFFDEVMKIKQVQVAKLRL